MSQQQARFTQEKTHAATVAKESAQAQKKGAPAGKELDLKQLRQIGGGAGPGTPVGRW